MNPVDDRLRDAICRMLTRVTNAVRMNAAMMGYYVSVLMVITAAAHTETCVG